MANARARLDRGLKNRGEDATLRRRIGTGSSFVTIPIRVGFRGYRPSEISGGIIQGDSLAILTPTQIYAAGSTWPATAGGDVMPRVNDGLTVQSRVRNVQAVVVITEAGEVVRIELQCRG